MIPGMQSPLGSTPFTSMYGNIGMSPLFAQQQQQTQQQVPMQSQMQPQATLSPQSALLQQTMAQQRFSGTPTPQMQFIGHIPQTQMPSPLTSTTHTHSHIQTFTITILFLETCSFSFFSVSSFFEIYLFCLLL